MRSNARRLATCAALALAPLALAPSLAAAQTTLASSGFGAGAEGWTIGDFFDPARTPSAPTFVAAGGNPGGHLRTGDVSNWVAFMAPAAFLGDQSAAYGGTLSFDLNTLAASTDRNDFGLVHLAGAGRDLFYDPGPVAPTAAWTSFVVPLVGSSPWRIGSMAGPTPTVAQMQIVLADLTAIWIQADIIDGDDDTGLDNVVLATAATTVPEPATVALVGIGLAVLAGVSARRRRRV